MKNKIMISLLMVAFMSIGIACENQDSLEENSTNNPVLETEIEENENLDGANNEAEIEDYIELKKAKEIAIEESGNSNAIIIEYEKDYDFDNLNKYEIKVQLDNEKLEIDIDAKTAKVLKSELEKSDYDINSYSEYIGLDRAEEVAMNAVEEGYTINEFELEDHDDNDPTYYEFEFKDESRKKSIKIKVDAKTANIIKN